MSHILPDPVVGAMAGFILGFLCSFGLDFLGIDASGIPALSLGVLGSFFGCMVGRSLQGPVGRARTVARWCLMMSIVIGTISFLCGFVGPILLHPDLPQGPLLGIFYTGPLGALAGAVLGALIGLMAPGEPYLRRQRG